jgi:hypothetical protein
VRGGCGLSGAKTFKKDIEMKIYKKTFNNLIERRLGMNINNISRLYSALFFVNPHFLSLEPITKMADCLLPKTKANA